MSRTGKNFILKTHVPSYCCDRYYEATVPFFFSAVQDAACLHTREKGCDIPSLNKEGKTWMVLRNILEIERVPHFAEEIEIETFPLLQWHFVGPRMVLIRDSAGNQIAKSFSNWVIIDLENGHTPVGTAYLNAIMPPVEDPAFPNKREKFIHFDSVENKTALAEKTFETSYLDTDFNNHNGNIAYVKLIFDTIPPAFLSSNILKRIDISWLKETFLNEKLTVLVSQKDGRLYAQIRNIGNEAVCEAAMDFVSREVPRSR